MKIRQDFVTNSSSTSYIIAMKDEFTQENFFKALAIPTNFVFSNIFSELFDIIDTSKKSLDKVIKDKRYHNYKTIEDYIESRYDDDIVIKLKKLLNSNWIVYIGEFNDEGMGSGPLETFFCHTSILIDNDTIYLNSDDEGY